MAINVTYKNSNITSFSEGTKILKTSGKYLEDDITINSDTEFFYVYCTSNCDVYKIPILNIENWTFDITSLVHDGYLYGGYYSSVFGTPSQTFTAADLKTKTFVNGIWNDTEGTPYTGSKATAFKRVNAFTASGISMTPTANTIYYLKEVPNDYLRTFVVPWAPEEGESLSSKITVVVGLDDGNYTGTYLISHELLESTRLGSTLKIQDNTYTLKQNMSGQVYPDKTINVPRGYMGSFEQDISSFSNNSLLSYTPCWKTVDNVYVTNKFTTTVNIGSHTVETISTSHSSHSYPAVSTDISTIVQNDDINVTMTNNSITIPAGYYSTQLSRAIASGTFAISTNGNYNIANYATVDVNVQPNLQSRYGVIPVEGADQTITADSGYDGLSSVTVLGISNTFVGSQVPRFSGGVINPAETRVLAVANGEYVDGADVYIEAIPTNYVGSSVTRINAATITPGTTAQTIAANTYLTGTQTIAGDANLIASNIKSGVSIFGINGTYSAPTYTNGDNLSYGG